MSSLIVVKRAPTAVSAPDAEGRVTALLRRRDSSAQHRRRPRRAITSIRWRPASDRPTMLGGWPAGAKTRAAYVTHVARCAGRPTRRAAGQQLRYPPQEWKLATPEMRTAFGPPCRPVTPRVELLVEAYRYRVTLTPSTG